MKKGLERISTVGMSRQVWLDHRQGGLGGSDIGSIFGLDRYKPAIKLFHQKIGWWKTDEDDNVAAYFGRNGEEYIYNVAWKYWDYQTNKPDKFLYYANNDIVQRKAKRINSIIINPEYPWLRANIDYEINKHDGKGNGILELKMPSTMHWNAYEDGIPPGYLLQLQTYMAVCGYDYGEIFALKDGRHCEVFPYERNDSLIGGILERTKDFWDRVLEARKIVSDKSIPSEEKQMLIAQLEPDPAEEEGKAYEDYMKERFRDGAYDGAISASEEIEQARELYWSYHQQSTDYGKKKQHYKNLIQQYMDQNEANAIQMKDEKLIRFDGKRLTIPKLKK
jgi:predicted phage-related endonuclease